MADDLASVEAASSNELVDARALFDGYHQPVSVFGLDGTYRYVNGAGLTLLAKTSAELLGRRYLDIFPDLADHPFHAAFQRVASGAARDENLEFYYAPIALWSSQRVQRVGDAVVVFWEDITRRKEHAGALEGALTRAAASERQLRMMIEGMPQLAWTARPDGFIDYYNPRWYEYTGTTPAQMEGWGWQSVHDPALLPSVIERWQRSIATGDPFEMEFPLRGADGSFRWFLTRIAPIRDESGAVVKWVGINADIHAQKTAIDELDSTLQSMGDAFFLLDREWRIVRVNRRQEELSKVARADSIGRVFWEVFPSAADPSSGYWKEYHRAVEEQVPVHFAERYEPLGLWTEVDAYPSPDGRLAVFFRDISDRQRATEALAEERAVLQALFREAPVGLAIFDEELRYIRLNAVLAEMNGATVAAHLGRHVLEMLPDMPPEMLEHWREVLRTGRPIVGTEVVGTTPRSTEPRAFRLSLFPVRVGDTTIGLGAVVDDVTDDRRLAEERREAIDALKVLVETSAALAASLDYEETLARVADSAVPRLADICTVYVRNIEGRPEQVAVASTSRDRSEAVRSVHREAVMDDDLPFGYPNVLRTGRTELVPAVTPEMLARAARGPRHRELIEQTTPRSWIIVPMTAHGKTTGAVAFARVEDERPYRAEDVPLAEEIGRRAALAIENARLYRDAKLAVEAERAARDKAEEATRLKDEFLATLSHELRTPLNAMLGWARLLQAGAVGEAQKGKALDTIVRNAVSQSQLIEDLLDVSRIISGKLRLTVDPTDMGLIVEAALEAVRPAAEAKGVRLQHIVDPDVGLINGDPGRLQQVVWNLLANAVKFTPRGGRVHVMVRREESSVEITVADTGAGITADFLPYVFHRFRQQDGAITRKSGGLGLGLAIVKHLVELHGGTVEVESEGEGQGATFVVRLPVAPVRSASIGRAESARFAARQGSADVVCPSELDGLEILVVDDEPDARDLIQLILEQCKARVTTAGSAAEALAAVSRVRPAVIVSDIGMPDEDGYAFIRKLRAMPREDGGRTPAIALTAYARPDDRTRALREGFQSHAAKPVDPQELVIVIANLAGRFA